MPTAEQAKLLENPWDFKQFAFGLPVHSAYTQREALLHLVHTDTFEAIVSREHKQLIAKRFASALTAPTDDVDRQISQVRDALTATYGEEFDFYDERLRPRWQGGSSGTWDEFVKWAKRFYDDPTFDKDERDYKFDAVRPLTRAREALLSGGEWRPLLREGFLNRNNNLTDWRASTASTIRTCTSSWLTRSRFVCRRAYSSMRRAKLSGLSTPSSTLESAWR